MIDVLEHEGGYFTKLGQATNIGFAIKDCITHENKIILVGDIKSWWEVYAKKVRQNFRKLRLRKYIEFENKNILCLSQDEYTRKERIKKCII